ncbi:DUF5367 domain-containing protein [Edaphobacter bradus]|uniref:DUF5367 domain-containing protein n=1 Tax=Edaphobacter bradus TaxID=2259016 RepID=UPI0021E0D443|nr:DUF5367 domain-containing protein [Edaphobacter bradus]
MRLSNVLFFLTFGLVFWILGTLLSQVRGHIVFETTLVRYWISFIATPILSTAVCILLLRWRHIPVTQWAVAALLIAIPGMIGEAVLLSHFTAFMPKMQPTTAGRFGAFLFATYAFFLAICELVTLRTGGPPLAP